MILMLDEREVHFHAITPLAMLHHDRDDLLISYMLYIHHVGYKYIMT
jgi:hypothetical protein